MKKNTDKKPTKRKPKVKEKTGENQKQNTKKERYSVAWYDCSENSSIAERFFVPGYDGYLPFFVWGEELEAFEKNTKAVKFREEHLLKGILYSLYEFDHNPNYFHREKDKETLRYLVYILGTGFQCDNPEKLILDVAYNVRMINGSEASCIILEVGKTLVPQSSKIKSDLICDLWVVISNPDMSRHGSINDLLEEVIQLFHQIDFADIHPNAKELVCYYALCALFFLKKPADFNDHLEKFIYPNVKHPELTDKIKLLLETPDDLIPKDMEIEMTSDCSDLP